MTEPLATVDDVLALGIMADEQVVAASLAKASARFRAEARHGITAQDYAMVLRPYGGRVRLPHTPVSTVDGVWALNAQGVKSTALAAWTFDGVDTIDLRGLESVIVNAGTFTTTNVWAEWSAGYASVPEDVRWAVASMVERALSAPQSGIAGETIGDYTWRGGGYTASGAFSMSRDELEVAHKYRPRTTSVGLRLA